MVSAFIYICMRMKVKSAHDQDFADVDSLCTLPIHMDACIDAAPPQHTVHLHNRIQPPAFPATKYPLLQTAEMPHLAVCVNVDNTTRELGEGDDNVIGNGRVMCIYLSSFENETGLGEGKMVGREEGEKREEKGSR